MSSRKKDLPRHRARKNLREENVDLLAEKKPFGKLQT